ncbi:MAG: hypothetical protein ABEK59_02320 [Halobacteria archaeon]
MGTAAADRLTHFQITVDAERWLEWAEQKNIHPYVQAYIKQKPEKLIEENVFESTIKATPRSWAVVSDYLYKAQEQGLSTQRQGNQPSDLQILLEGRIGQKNTADFIASIEQYGKLYPPEEYLKALNDSKNPQRLLEMAPIEMTPNFGLIFSLSEYCAKQDNPVDALIDAMLVFKRFTKCQDNVNREDMYRSAVSILSGRLMKQSSFWEVVQNDKFANELSPDVTAIPELKELEQKAKAA